MKPPYILYHIVGLQFVDPYIHAEEERNQGENTAVKSSERKWCYEFGSDAVHMFGLEQSPEPKEGFQRMLYHSPVHWCLKSSRRSR